jgi:hypothetical protein
MRPEQFTLWLQGFLDGKGEQLAPGDFGKVKDKLSVVIGQQVMSRLLGTEPYYDDLAKKEAGGNCVSAGFYNPQSSPVALAVDNTKLPF